MLKFNKLFDPKLSTGSFVIRAFSATLGMFLVLSLLFSLLFSTMLYDSIEYIYREIYSIFSVVYSITIDSIIFVFIKIINFKDSG